MEKIKFETEDGRFEVKKKLLPKDHIEDGSTKYGNLFLICERNKNEVAFKTKEECRKYLLEAGYKEHELPNPLWND